MLTKAIIKQLNELDNNKFLVYIPLLKLATQSVEEATLEATLCSEDSISNSLRVGDVVFVDFEDNRYNKPVIQGKLFNKNNETNKQSQAYFRTLTVEEKTELKGDLYIDGINMKDILIGLKELLKSSGGLSILDISSEVESLKNRIDKLENK